jgi:hypothetical protein
VAEAVVVVVVVVVAVGFEGLLGACNEGEYAGESVGEFAGESVGEYAGENDNEVSKVCLESCSGSNVAKVDPILDRQLLLSCC